MSAIPKMLPSLIILLASQGIIKGGAIAEWLAYSVVTCDTWVQPQAPLSRPSCKWVQEFPGRLRRSRQAADHSSSFTAVVKETVNRKHLLPYTPLGVISLVGAAIEWIELLILKNVSLPPEH